MKHLLNILWMLLCGVTAQQLHAATPLIVETTSCTPVAGESYLFVHKATGLYLYGNNGSLSLQSCNTAEVYPESGYLFGITEGGNFGWTFSKLPDNINDARTDYILGGKPADGSVVLAPMRGAAAAEEATAVLRLANGEYLMWYDSAFYTIADGTNPDAQWLAYRCSSLEAKAVWNAEASVITWYYDSDSHEGEGVVLPVERINGSWPWAEYKEEVETVCIDPSFVNYRLTDCAQWFENFQATTYQGLKYLNTSECTDFTSMFSYCQAAELDLRSLDTSNGTNFTSMFDGCVAAELDLRSFDTRKGTNFYGMFLYGLMETVRVSDLFIISEDANTEDMFDGCDLLIGGEGTEYDEEFIDGTYARIDGGESQPGYFTGDPAPKAVYDIQTFCLTFTRRSDVTGDKIYDMPDYSEDLEVVPAWISDRKPICSVKIDASFATYHPKSCYRWFNSIQIEKIEGLENLNTKCCENMASMFRNSIITRLDLSSLDIRQVEKLDNMFAQCNGLELIFVKRDTQLNATQLEHSTGMFTECYKLLGQCGSRLFNNGRIVTGEAARVDKEGQRGYFTDVAIAPLFFGEGGIEDPTVKYVTTIIDAMNRGDYRRYYDLFLDGILNFLDIEELTKMITKKEK